MYRLMYVCVQKRPVPLIDQKMDFAHVPTRTHNKLNARGFQSAPAFGEDSGVPVLHRDLHLFSVLHVNQALAVQDDKARTRSEGKQHEPK